LSCKHLRRLLWLRRKIKLNEDRLEYLKEGTNVFKAFKKKSIPKTTDPAFILKAPLLFSLSSPMNLELKVKLVKPLKIEEVIRYSFIRKATFLVGEKSKLSKKFDIYEQINAILSVLNKRLSGNIIPIHDISMETNKYYIVWLVPENLAKYVSDFMDIINDYEIFIKRS